ncbi:hypothetical protein, partial [Staphylococcus lutrae]
NNYSNFITFLIFIIILSLISTTLEINTSVFIPDYFSGNLTSINSLVQLMRSIVNFVSPIFSFVFTNNFVLALLVMFILQMVNLLIYLNMGYKTKNTVSKKREKSSPNEKTNDKNSFLYIINNKQILLIVII